MKVANSVDMGVAVVQVMVACKPSPCIVATSEWHFGFAPFHILWRQSGLSCARLDGLTLDLPKLYGQCRSILERSSVCLRSISFGHLWNDFLHRDPRKWAVLGGVHLPFRLHVAISSSISADFDVVLQITWLALVICDTITFPWDQLLSLFMMSWGAGFGIQYVGQLWRLNKQHYISGVYYQDGVGTEVGCSVL